MIDTYRIVPFIPAGRKRVMSVLIDNLRVAQRPLLDETDILDLYREAAKKLLSDDYYKLLGQAV